MLQSGFKLARILFILMVITLTLFSHTLRLADKSETNKEAGLRERQSYRPSLIHADRERTANFYPAPYSQDR